MLCVCFCVVGACIGGWFCVTNAARCRHNCLPGIWQIETQFGEALISGRGNK